MVTVVYINYECVERIGACTARAYTESDYPAFNFEILANCNPFSNFAFNKNQKKPKSVRE